MIKKDKILIISNGKDSILEFHKDLISYLIDAGFLITIFNGSLKRSELSNSFSLYEISQIKLIEETPRLEIKNLYTSYRIIFKELNTNNYKFTICFMINTSILFSFLSYYFNKTKFISTIEGLGSTFNKKNNKFFTKVKIVFINIFMNIIFLRFNKFIFVNNDDSEYLNKNIITIRKKKQLLLQNGNGIRLFKNNLKLQNIGEKKIKFIMVSRLIEEKGIYEFINASLEVKKLFPEAVFSHIGDEPIPPKKMDTLLLNKIKRSEHIDFLGARNDVGDILMHQDIFVLPSFSEGFPASIMEALATGLFVITTKVAGCKNAISKEYEGVLVNKMDYRDLAEKMLYCCSNIDTIRKNSLKIRKEALLRFDSKINQKLIYDFIVN